MALLLGLGAAVVYGSADFLGGLASRRSPVLAVVAVSQLAGLGVLLALIWFLPGTPSAVALAWGAASGVAGGGGVALLYRGLSLGRMGVIAPTTAVGAAAVPVLFGLATGERPSALALMGVVVALAAIVLVSLTPAPDHAGTPEAVAPGVGVAAPSAQPTARLPAGLPEAVAAGLAFGAFFILLAEAGDDAGLWPLIGARASSLGLVVAGALLTGRALRPARGTLGLVVGSGVLDMLANALYLLATFSGLLSLVAVLTSLYPASTVVLARVALRERLAPVQIFGLTCAAGGVTLIGLG